MRKSPNEDAGGASLTPRHQDLTSLTQAHPSMPRHEHSLRSFLPSTSHAASAAASQHEPTVMQKPQRLSFFQKHFTKPSHEAHDKPDAKTHRRFSFFTRGCLFATLMLLILALGIVAGAVAGTAHHQHQKVSTTPQPGSSPEDPLSPGVPFQPSQGSPIRAAIDENFPDPTIWSNNGMWYAFATNNAAGILSQPDNASEIAHDVSNIQLATSTDFIRWQLHNSTDDPLPVTGDWAIRGLTQNKPRRPRGNVWAPGLIQRKSDNKFVIYYSADRADIENPVAHRPQPHCIGAAVSRSDSPAGPYDPLNKTLACPWELGGAIDPAAFEDTDGALYVVYKVDGNNIGNGGLCGNTKKPIVSTPIMLQKMHPNATEPDGEPIQILDRITSDGPLVEAPALIRSPGGVYFLFFSSGCTRSPTYDVKYATSLNITGPYKRSGHPLLATGDFGLHAPGSVAVYKDDKGSFRMAFAARVFMASGGIRAMFTAGMEFDGRVVHLVSDNATST